MRVADTSVLYAFLDEADAHHDRAVDAFSDPEPIVVPGEILVETVDLVGYRFGPKAARFALEDLLGLAHLRRADPVNLEAVARVFEDHNGLSLADAFVVQTCRALAAPPLSIDQDIVDAVGG